MTRLGVWSAALRFGDPAVIADAAQELEELGYVALWYPAFGDGALEVADNVLGSTRTITVATGIRSVWAASAEQTAAEHAALTAAHPGRFLLGLGVSHAPVVEMEAPDQRYERPLATMRAYLDELDKASPPVPDERRARRARTQDAGARPRSCRGSAPVPGDARAFRSGARRAGRGSPPGA